MQEQPLSSLLNILRCPKCKHEKLTLSDKDIFCCACRRNFPINGKSVNTKNDFSDFSYEWRRKEETGLLRYSHEVYNSDVTIPKLFEGFIAITLKKEDIILDIGCGILPQKPHYVEDLNLNFYIGLEPLGQEYTRDYFCLAGAVAENVPLRDHCVDAVISATSLDHIENIVAAVAEIKRVLKAEGCIYLWVGLYDPEYMAKAKNFFSVFFKGNLLHKILKLSLPHFVFFKFLIELMMRRHKLTNQVPLDNEHINYFTYERLKAALDEWGLQVKREVVVPGSTSIFVECAALMG
ncbi:MAG: class I SAM-dependent methyltransferase [Deltaproteobacteria bacterium]|nr:class I SAM-dependent methyltransferase [Deltaproteobacteria bacterium]